MRKLREKRALPRDVRKIVIKPQKICLLRLPEKVSKCLRNGSIKVALRRNITYFEAPLHKIVGVVVIRERGKHIVRQVWNARCQKDDLIEE